jgi:RecA-family ATPase
VSFAIRSSNDLTCRFLGASCAHRARCRSTRRASAAHGDRPRGPRATVSLVLPDRCYLARGAVTELDATIKRGKTTLLRDQVRCITTGQAWLNCTTKQTRVVWLTEERRATFLPGLRRSGLADSMDVIVLSYWDVSGRPWPAIVDLAVAEAAARDAGVLIVDTLAQFAGLRGDDENNAGAALAAMAPLQRAARTGLAVELTRHERKSGGEPGESARGSSAYGGAADIIVAIRSRTASTRPHGVFCARSAGSPKRLRPWSSKSFLPI